MRTTISVIIRHLALALMFLSAAGSAGAQSSAAATPDQPLRLSANQRYLIDRGGQPFLMQGDAAWSLIANLSKEQAQHYLRSRHEQGFNAILVNLVEHKFSRQPPRNAYGEVPFADPRDWSIQNEKYFEHADWVLREAAAAGITVLLAPIYLGYPDTDQGFIEEVQANGTEKLLAYGRFLGQRYRDFDNIIWVMGGDRNPEEVRERVNAVALGIREHDRRHLFTAHCLPECQPPQQYPYSWLDISNSYSYQIVHQAVLRDYNREPIRPTFLIESIYEGEHNASPTQVRRQAYWAVLLGGFGHVFGNRPIWLFDSGWESALHAAGSVGMTHWGNLLRSRRWFDLVPDQQHKIVVDGIGELRGLDYLAAARTSDGRTLIAYLPTARPIGVDLSQLAGPQTQAHWFNPRTGQATRIGKFATQGIRRFVPPHGDAQATGEGSDWVLVLDDAAAHLAPPGSR